MNQPSPRLWPTRNGITPRCHSKLCEQGGRAAPPIAEQSGADSWLLRGISPSRLGGGMSRYRGDHLACGGVGASYAGKFF